MKTTRHSLKALAAGVLALCLTLTTLPAAGAALSDVADSDWYAQAVQWAAQTGIVKGTGSARFEPDGLVTWEQLAVVLDRLLGEDSALGGELDSQGVLTRGEAAVLFQRLLTGDLAA